MASHRHAVSLVDDTPDTRYAVAHLLELLGYDVRTARNGREALDVLRSGTRPCLILLDVMMPEMSGEEFRRIQQEDPALRNIPVVVVTALSRVQRMPEPLAALARYEKPIDADCIVDLVRAHCRQPGA